MGRYYSISVLAAAAPLPLDTVDSVFSAGRVQYGQLSLSA